MKFGLALPNSGPIASVEAICRVAEMAEAAGFDALLVHDHVSYDTEWLVSCPGNSLHEKAVSCVRTRRAAPVILERIAKLRNAVLAQDTASRRARTQGLVAVLRPLDMDRPCPAGRALPQHPGCTSHATNYPDRTLLHRTSGLTQPHADIAPNLYESLITLAFVARATSTIRLATAVLVLPLRDPRVLARQLITLQALSHSRLTLGIGSGDYPADYRVMEIDYRRKAALTREYTDALATLLPGGRVDFAGETVRVERGTFFPKVDPIPILVGGGIRLAPGSGKPELFDPPLRLIARRCHGWMPEGPISLIGQGIERITELAREVGRGDTRFEIRAQSPLYIGDDDLEAMSRVGRGLDYELVGKVATIYARLARYRDAGVHAMNVRCFADDEASYFAMVQRFADEIMPAFSEGS